MLLLVTAVVHRLGLGGHWPELPEIAAEPVPGVEPEVAEAVA